MQHRIRLDEYRKWSNMILVTGGAGYIGSHVCLALLESGLEVVAIGNLYNSNKASLGQVQSLRRRSQADIRDEQAVHEIIRDRGVEAAIHAAGLKGADGTPCSFTRPRSHGLEGMLRCVLR